ncbi:OmpA family protein [Falsirhodobacter halotolerans]|uniref:OmpA family protein n=1 Tax=Falsirhodobacter halotolerans TaxID=1146892 RepID=UPI001FD4FF3D|nr:OmpA family protein [Falsirhodobacter halotolerans]MCJ8140654.1 OmpA family protein [Falsirhodobacter halotolerans]
MRALVLLALMATPAAAFTPPVPGPAEVTRTEILSPDSTTLPIGPQTVEGREGAITRTAWRITPPDGFTTLSLVQPIRAALTEGGWTLVYDCETDGCGGFDFRFGLDLFPEPEMHVDLGDFRWLTARKEAAWLGIMVSRSPERGFLQVTEIAPGGAPLPTTPAPMPDGGSEFEEGSVPLDVAFPTGGGALAPDQPGLAPLRDWLDADAARGVILVGHTDSSGGREANIALSRQRAAAVRDWLVAQGIAADRIDVEGVGPLAPRATNRTEEGRTLNRRVEAMAR